MLALLSYAAVVALSVDADAGTAPDVQHLGGNVSVLIGTSCNVLILPGENGVLIVDDQRRSNVPETLAAVSKVAKSPVRFVIDTHWHLDHSGGNGAFAAAGAQIIAQRNVRARRSAEQYMAAYKQHIPADPPAALPTRVYDDRLVLREGSETVELRHVANAHTDGDTLVWFRKANVIAMGDVFFNHIFPFIDRSSGGSIQGMIKGVDAALALANDRTRIVPAHGPVATRSELGAYRAMLQDVARRVKGDMRAGWTLEQVVASHPAAPYRAGMEGEEDRFVEAIYDSYANENLHHRL
jgi:glyoxylase-like metal-dependent hydrolase (beta-lactamase superfamily II)